MESEQANNQEQIAQFMSITGADSSSAAQFLEITNWTLSEAVNLYLESGGQSSAQNPPSTTSATPPPPPLPMNGMDDVRAPDPSTRQRLVGGGIGSGGDPFDHIMGTGFHSNLSSRGVQINAFRDFAAEGIAMVQGGSTFGGDEGDLSQFENFPTTNPTLSSLFQPPVSIMYHGSFANARKHAKQEHKWLIVNIQMPTVFDSCRLNRDTWSDEVVQNIIMSGFVFWQVNYDSPEGKRYCTYYKQETRELPIVALIDPRTGQEMKKFNGFIDQENMIEKLSDFCDQYQMEQPPMPIMNNDQKQTSTSANISDFSTSVNGNSKVVDMTQSSDDEVEEKENEKEDEIFVISDEPADGPMTVRLQIRTASGRMVRRFLKTEPISLLFKYIRSEVPESRTRSFDLRTQYPTRIFKETEETIEEAKLDNASLVMHWV